MLTLYREYGPIERLTAPLRERLRARRTQRFLQMIAATAAERGRCRIIDLGGRRDYWSGVPRDFLAAHGVSIHISNLEPQPDAVGDDPLFSWRREDATGLDYPDAAFDLVHSNSVVEHVGGWDQMAAFAAGVRRIGRGYFIQTPSYWFPLEPHFGTLFFAQLPRPVQVRMLLRRGRGFHAKATRVGEAIRALETTQLLTRPMLAELFPDARLEAERVLGLEKSLIAVRPP